MMKKRMYILVAAMIMSMALAGCGTSNFGMEIDEDSNVEITAENAGVDDSAQVATFTVAENEKVVIEPALTKGKVLLQLIQFGDAEDIEADIEESIGQGEPVLEVEVSGNDAIECNVDSGDYTVIATVTEKATGTIVMQSIEG